MCFFDQERFACGDWKWGHFRQHCNREYRIGETCGMKLVFETYIIESTCKLCKKIDTKKRRRALEQGRLHGWANERNENVRQVIEGLGREIYELECERLKRSQAIDNMPENRPSLLGEKESETDSERRSQSRAGLQLKNSSTSAPTLRVGRRWQVVGPEDKLYFRGQMSDSEKARFILKSTSSRGETDLFQRGMPKENGRWGLKQGNPFNDPWSSSTLDDPNLESVKDDRVGKGGLTPAQKIRKAQDSSPLRAFRERKGLDVESREENFRGPQYLSSSEPAPASSNASRFIFNRPMPQDMGGTRDAGPRNIPSNYNFANTTADDYVVPSYINNNDRNSPRLPTLLDSTHPSEPASPPKGGKQQLSALCLTVTPKLFVTATISQDCTGENQSNLLIALKDRKRCFKDRTTHGLSRNEKRRKLW